MAGVLRVTVLGCGSSAGVPRVGNDWGACDPSDPRNRRSRCSLLLQRWSGEAGDANAATTVVIDTSPDLRAQFLAAGVVRLDAIVFTHDHADQTHGIDDVRPLAYVMRRRIPTYMDDATAASLTHRFHYCFHGVGGYPPILEDADRIHPGKPLTIDGPGGAMTLEPLDQDHGSMRSLGFRIGKFAYSNDMVDLSKQTLRRLEGLDVWIADALRYTPHPTHAHLERTLGWVERLKPARTILTNMHIDLDYARVRAETPDHVEPAYDGLQIELPL